MPLVQAQPDALSATYARSLFELAQTAGSQEQIETCLGELDEILEITRQNPMFGEFLASRVLPIKTRAKSLDTIFKDSISDLTFRFLQVLNAKERLGHLYAIVASFDALVQESFGRIEVDPASVLHFKSGLLGFSDAHEFALIELDNENYAQFRVLQCVTDPTLSFIVFPPSLDNGLIDRADIEAAGKAVRIPFENLVVLLLVTVRRRNEGNSLSVNLRAPVLIDPIALEGVQYVLPSDKYPVRFNLQ